MVNVLTQDICIGVQEKKTLMMPKGTEHGLVTSEQLVESMEKNTLEKD
jgi:hypothetical protein